MPFRDATSIVLGTTVMLIALFGVLFFLSSQCFAPSDPRTVRLQPTATSAAAQGGSNPATRTPSSNDGPETTATAARTNTPQATAPAATSTAVPPSPAPPTSAQAPPPAPAPPPPPPAAAAANFSGAGQVLDTVTSGSGAGQTYTFDVTLVQSGNQLTGGNSGIQISGSVNGQTATATYTQPALGITGTFEWTFLSSGNAAGTFTSSVPNAGTSQLVRR